MRLRRKAPRAALQNNCLKRTDELGSPCFNVIACGITRDEALKMKQKQQVVRSIARMNATVRIPKEQYDGL